MIHVDRPQLVKPTPNHISHQEETYGRAPTTTGASALFHLQVSAAKLTNGAKHEDHAICVHLREDLCSVVGDPAVT